MYLKELDVAEQINRYYVSSNAKVINNVFVVISSGKESVIEVVEV